MCGIGVGAGIGIGIGSGVRDWGLSGGESGEGGRFEEGIEIGAGTGTGLGAQKGLRTGIRVGMSGVKIKIGAEVVPGRVMTGASADRGRGGWIGADEFDSAGRRSEARRHGPGRGR